MRIAVNNLKLPVKHNENDIIEAVAKYLKINKADINEFIICNKSIDARDKLSIKYIYSIETEIKGAERFLGNKRFKNVSLPKSNYYSIPHISSYRGKPVIIGAGPAGLFCAYIFVLAGLKPIILERGEAVDNRKEAVEEFWRTGILKPNSNVQFGEGGAGTFSDGKLNTLVKDKNGRCTFVLQTFVKFGAPVNILYDAKPHIGTDKLIDVIKNLRNYLLDNGAEVRFNALVTKINIGGGKVSSVIINDAEEIATDRVVLAVGHSARDTFEHLEHIGVNMSPKPFAVGFRVEHPATFINIDRYGEKEYKNLPTAAYKLTAQTDGGRGVYSFCMCPGGYVVNASSESGMIAVNGMSYSSRKGDNSNSAIIVTVNPEDYPGTDNLSGMRFQRELESKAYELGKGKIPVSHYGDFYDAVNADDRFQKNLNRLCLQYPDYEPNIKGAYEYTELHSLFTVDMNRSIVQGMHRFGNIIKNYDSVDTIISGIESRTSSPVKIWRNDLGYSDSAFGIYPCGEGAGYAGGITSAAMDGMYIAESIINS